MRTQQWDVIVAREMAFETAQRREYLEVDQSTIVPGSEIWTHPVWTDHTEILEALLEDVDVCEDGETTIARDGAIAIRGFSASPAMVRRQLKKTRYHRYYCRLDQLSGTLGTGPSERISMLPRSPEVSSVPDMRLGENSRKFITVAKPREQKPFFLGASWTSVPLRPWRSLMGYWCPRGTRRETTT